MVAMVTKFVEFGRKLARSLFAIEICSSIGGRGAAAATVVAAAI